MEFERQKPVSDEYRENWERLFGCSLNEPAKIDEILTTPKGTAYRYLGETEITFPNGCPILNEDNG